MPLTDLDDIALFNRLIADAEQPFSGWDFAYISKTDRLVEAPLAWSYASRLLRHLRQAASMLDMGTGGREFLTKLQPFPAYTVATEGYPPNVSIARERLEPLGVAVHEVAEDLQLPFADDSIDLVINRHESYSPDDVLRVLKSGGRFITQQVGGQNDIELNRLLGAPANDEYAHWNLDFAARELEAAGFQLIEQHEDFPPARFFDIGAVVYFLKAVPWQIPDFSVERHHDALFALHRVMQQCGYVDIPIHRFLIVTLKA
ncbi:MAG: class I SAM-dependent methyltransferase [Chloroflexia bacterium]|nr:class I SAM-dependent methyltransferase [Chloroflexia bacterium]